MAEIRQEVKTFVVHYLCDECGKEAMEPDRKGVVSFVMPPAYDHTCPGCGAKATFGIEYPRIETEAIA